MTKMKFVGLVFAFLILITFSNCEIAIVDINDLDKKVVNFESLPDTVQKVYSGEFESQKDNSGLVLLNSTSNYEFTIEKSGPCTDYYLTYDKKSDTKFKVPYGTAFPFVLYNDILFIADDYNVQDIKKATDAKYFKYSLK